MSLDLNQTRIRSIAIFRNIDLRTLYTGNISNENQMNIVQLYIFLSKQALRKTRSSTLSSDPHGENSLQKK